MDKSTKLSIHWFYDLIKRGECDILDFKQQLDDKLAFGKSFKNFSNSYDEMARDVVAFANFKGGFIFVGIVDSSKEINTEFQYEDKKVFELVKQIQDRTQPTITIIPHRLKVNNVDLLLIEIPFSNQLQGTTKGEYLIRCNNGNRVIESHEMNTISAEKGMIVYDSKTWDLQLKSIEKDIHGNPVPGWQDIDRARDLFQRLKNNKPNSPFLKGSIDEFNETLGLTKEKNEYTFPTTTGILIIGNDKALREFPYNQIKYIRYYEDGSYTPFEYRGNILSIIDDSFNQLKSEIKVKEFHFGLFREYIEDYPEVVLRELLVNAVAHRDYSRQQIIEIRKYPNYLEFESPGRFPQGIDEYNFLRKTNPRNPAIMDILREINYAEKAGSGFDKIFTALLSKGKSIPNTMQTDNSVIIRVEADMYAEKLVELSIQYKQITGTDLDMDKLIVLNYIYSGKKIDFKQLEDSLFVNRYQLRKILSELQEIEFIETTGKTSDLKYIIHKSKLESVDDKISYSKLKKQEKARQKEAIIRYLDDIDEIDNEEARRLLKLAGKDISLVSRLFSELKESNLITEARRNNRKIWYCKVGK